VSQAAHIPETPTYIGFGDYTTHIPGNIPAAVQQATDRFLSTRAARVAEKPDWEQLRQAAHEIRLHTLLHLDSYLEQVERQVTKAGGHVHWAREAAEARAIVIDIAKRHNVRTAVKVKSMATEEIGLNHALETAGIQAYETDLGEFIIQLAGSGPSHIIVPAVHLKKEEVAALFHEKLGVEAPADPLRLAAIARATLRERFLAAEMGVSGANFLVAETGTLVIVSNEGNGRMCTTLPDRQGRAGLGFPDGAAQSSGAQRHRSEIVSLHLVHHWPAAGGGRERPAGVPPGDAGQRSQSRVAGSSWAGNLEVHSLRLLPQRVPGL